MKKELQKQDPAEIRLNAIIRLLSDFLITQNQITKNSIYQSLNQVGLSSTEIGQIFGKSQNEISSKLPKKSKSNSKTKTGE